MTVIAWTGHRPKDLPARTYMEFRDCLDALGMGARKNVEFVVGGALGVDTWAAEYALSHHIPYTLILPFPVAVMAKFWNPAQASNLRTYAEGALSVQIIHDEDSYDVRAYQLRNEAMVNAADVVFAVWNYKAVGGTANCIRYALSVGKDVWNLWPLDQKLHRVRKA